MNQVKHIQGISGILSTPKKNVPYIADFICEACINFATFLQSLIRIRLFKQNLSFSWKLP